MFFILTEGCDFLFNQLREDIACVKDRDPAALSAIEILLLYPGLKAIRLHRIANKLYKRKMFFAARWVSQRASKKTGIEIHPAVTIGKRFFIEIYTGAVFCAMNDLVFREFLCYNFISSMQLFIIRYKESVKFANSLLW